jgi:hypothetical protein
MNRLLTVTTTVLAISAALVLEASPAAATFHEMSIREVYPAGDASYVELQMWAGGQNFVNGHHLILYGAGGTPTEDFKFTANVPNGANQSTIVVADTGYSAAFGALPPADATDPSLDLLSTGGAACWTEGEPPDCVSWGNFSAPGSLPSPPGSPAAPGGTAGMALRRTITPGCPTFLEPTDDSDDSATDFSLVPPAPRPNSVAPTEVRCGRSGESGPGPDPGGKGGAPQTFLRHKPPKRTHDRTPTFRFAADEPGASFQCKLDRKPFRSCRSPYTTKRLTIGSHVFKVRARDDSGKLDPTPASYRFRVLLRR